MKVLVVEDDDEKAERVKDLIIEANPDAFIVHLRSFAATIQTLSTEAFDLVVLDLMLPLGEKGEPVEAGSEILEMMRSKSINTSSDVIVLTRYVPLAESLAQGFADMGIVVCEYTDQSESWKRTIGSLLIKLSSRISRKFVVICALEKERAAFLDTRGTLGETRSLLGFDACDIEIDGHLGVAIVCPRMGLVNASVITARAIERFSPEVVCMPGICAGISGKCHIGQVLVAETCFEYQVGKYTPTGFLIEPYTLILEEPLRQELSRMAGQASTLNAMWTGISGTTVGRHAPLLCAFVSGSAVVADAEKVAEIIEQNRKICGLDMEAFGVMQAARLCGAPVKAFSAKAVVDFADDGKGDDFQNLSASLSARFCVEAVSRLLGGPLS